TLQRVGLAVEEVQLLDVQLDRGVLETGDGDVEGLGGKSVHPLFFSCATIRATIVTASTAAEMTRAPAQASLTSSGEPVVKLKIARGSADMGWYMSQLRKLLPSAVNISGAVSPLMR